MKLAQALRIVVVAVSSLSALPAVLGDSIDVPLWKDGAPGTESHRDEAERPVPSHEKEGWITNSGGHGFGMHTGEHAVNHWPDRLYDWMHDRGLLDK